MSDRSRLSTRIVRTPYGLSYATAGRSQDAWPALRERFSAEHKAAVAANIEHLSGNLVGVSSGWRDLTALDYDGWKAEFWSIIVHDGLADE